MFDILNKILDEYERDGKIDAEEREAIDEMVGEGLCEAEYEDDDVSEEDIRFDVEQYYKDIVSMR